MLLQLSAATTASTASTMTDTGSVTSRLEMMYKQRDSMDHSSAAYTRLLSDISKLEGQRTTLSRQVSDLEALEAQLAQAEPDTAAYANLQKQVDAAIDAKQSTLQKIDDDAHVTHENAQAATGAVSSSATPTTSSVDMSGAIATQQQAATLATQLKNHAVSQREQAQQQATHYLATGDDDGGPICPKTVRNPVTHVTTTIACTAAQIADAEQRFNVPALKVKEDEAIANEIRQTNRIQEIRDEGNQLQADAQTHQAQTEADSNDTSEAGKIKTKLATMLKGDDGKGVDNSVKFSDGTDVGLTTEEQRQYNDALQADITMVILGTVATRLDKCTAIPVETKVPDMVMAAAGGLAFVTGEVAEYSKLISVRNQLSTVMKDIKGDPSNKQIQALKSLRDSYKTILQAVENKIRLREASRDTFIAAAAMAAEEATMLATMTSQCTNSIRTKVEQGVSSANMWAMIGAATCIAYYVCMNVCTVCPGPCGSCIPGCQAMQVMPGWAGAATCAVAAVAYVNGSTCGAGGSSSTGLNQNRQNLCEDRNPARDPTHIHDDPGVPLGSGAISISKDVTDKCLAIKHVGDAADSACSGTIFATSGKGPYAPCDDVDKLYEKNNVTCKLDGSRHNILDGTQDPDFYKIEQKFTSIKPQKNYIEMVSDFIFSSVHAGMLSSMGISKTKVIEFLKAQTPIFANALDTQLSAPVWRAVSWAALAELIQQAIDTSINMREKILSDLQKIEAILAQVHDQTGLGNDGSKLDYGASNNYQALDLPIEQLPCITGSNAGKCKAVSTTLKSSSGFLELSGKTKELASKALKVADGLNGANTLSSGTMGSIKDLNSSSKALRANLEKRQQNLQKILTRNGAKIDIAKETTKFAGQLKGITKNALSASGMSAQEMRSMMGGASVAPSSASSTNNKKTSSSAGAGAGFGFNQGAQTVSKSSDTDSKTDGDGLTDAERAARLAAEAQAYKAGSSVDAAKMGDTVNEDNGYTLFEVITNRYQKSAYPRLFKRVKE